MKNDIYWFQKEGKEREVHGRREVDAPGTGMSANGTDGLK